MIVFGEAPGCYPFSKLIRPNTKSPLVPVPNLNVKLDSVIIPYSSGTTGPPKGVVLTHYNMVAGMESIL